MANNPLQDAFDSVVNAVKSVDISKIRSGLEVAQTGIDMASAAFEKPEIALAGLLKTFARRAMSTDLGDAGARDIAKVVITKIRAAGRKEGAK